MKASQPMESSKKSASSLLSIGIQLVGSGLQQKNKGEVIHMQSKKLTRQFSKKVQIDLKLIQRLELFKRSTIRRLVAGIEVGKSTVGRWVSLGLIKAHTNAIKPDLTAPNKLLRLRFSLQAIQFDRILNTLKFRSIHNTIHIDEKWFYITRTSHRFYLTPVEAEPHRTCKSKKFITKVMFMCAVCRPLFTEDDSVLFDGKIDIFPFTQHVPAQRSSKNRDAGILVTKPVDSITKDVIKACLINQILPAIKAKWPSNSNKIIYIHQDNARPHIKDSDSDFRVATSSDDFDIKLVHQPPNSPDTNVNDLGWSRAIQSIQTESSCHTVDQLVEAVVQSFEQLFPHTLNNVFLSLQGCMVEIMKVKGQNNYKISHTKKDTLIRQDRLPVDLEVSENLVRQCIYHMVSAGIEDGIRGLMNELGIQGIPNQEEHRL